MRFYIQQGFLTPDECVAALTLFPTPKTGTVNVLRDDTALVDAMVRATIRRSQVAFLTRRARLYGDTVGGDLESRLAKAIARANEIAFRVDIDELEPLQLARYDIGDGYDWHYDTGPGVDNRKLSASVQLTDPADYDGGDLELFAAAPTVRTQGALIVFPSYVPHRVAPVTRGSRQSIVAWAIGSRPYR